MDLVKKTFQHIVGIKKEKLLWEEVQRENDVIADIVVRMRTDQEFLGLIEKLYSLNRSRLTDVVNLLNVFLK